MARRAVRKVTLVAMSPSLAKPENPQLAWDFPSYGLHRVRAAMLAAPELAHHEVSAIELPMLEAGEVVERLLAEGADLVGFSVYLWSFPTLLAAARELRRRDPEITLIFGGPSAEPPMCHLPPHRDSAAVLDALVLGEGEIAIRELLATGAADRGGIAGLALPVDGLWRRTAARPLNHRLDELPSPAAMGLLRRRAVAYLETFRGCPMSCSFCEWGVMESGTHFSRESLVRELTAIRALEPSAIFQLDAALNLNQHAFRNLAAAEDEVGCLAESRLVSLLYPALMRQEHLDLLARVRSLHLSFGLQSFDEQVLAAVDRHHSNERLERGLDQLRALPNVESLAVELILGLPDDSPERFARSVERALALGVSVRIYRCLVLPNGLMTRAPASQRIRFDDQSLLLTSAAGWEDGKLAAEQARLDELTASVPGSYAGAYWWYFPPTAGAALAPGAALAAAGS